MTDRSECVRVVSRSHSWVSDEEPLRSRGDRENPRPRYVTRRPNDPSCCCTWREKGRQATVGRRSLKSRGHAFYPNVSAGRALCHLPLLLPSLPFRDPCLLTASSSYLMKDVEDRAGADFQDCVRASGTIWPPLPKTQGGVLFRDFFPESRPVTWMHLGCPPPPLLSLLSCTKRPHFVLPAKVTQFLWRTRHKSTHLTAGPQIYQPECFESGGHIMTRKEAGALSHASAAPRLDLSLILLQPAGKPDATKASGPHQFSQGKLLGNKSFWGFMKNETGGGGTGGCEEACCLDPKKTAKQGCVKVSKPWDCKKGQIYGNKKEREAVFYIVAYH